MSDEHRGLPVAGYKPQSSDKVALVNANKIVEERVLRVLDDLRGRADVDQDWLYEGRRQIERGFMSVNRAVFRPDRVALTQDEASR